MKTYSLAIALLFVRALTYAQSEGPSNGFQLRKHEMPLFNQTPAQWRYRMVAHLMSYSSPLERGAVELHGMGDEAAFDIITFMGNTLTASQTLTAAQTLTALDIIHKSFENPIAIQNGEDRKPTKSLRLLKMFQSTAADQTVKERIAIETSFLNAVPEKIVAPPMGVPGPPPAPGTTPFF